MGGIASRYACNITAAAAASVRPLDWVGEAPDWARRRSAWTDERRSSVWVTGMVGALGEGLGEVEGDARLRSDAAGHEVGDADEDFGGFVLLGEGEDGVYGGIGVWAWRARWW